MTRKKVFVFPAGVNGLKVLYHLDDTYEVLAFLHSMPPYYKELEGHKVISPAEIKDYEYDFIILAIADYEEVLKQQLTCLGVPDEKIVVFCPNDRITWLDERYAMARTCIRYIHERNIKGAVAELGVYKGAFAAYLSTMLPDRKIYLFDTFSGFSEKDQAEKETNIIGGVAAHDFSDTSVQEVLSAMPVKDAVVIKKGWFPETAHGVDDTFCFVSLDADLYAPILAGLEFFYPRLEKGGYIFIHDFESFRYPGCKRAVLEFCEKNGISFVPILDRCASVIITK